MAEIYQRSSKSVTEEKIFGAKALHFTCETRLGQLLTVLVLKRRFVSRLVAKHYRSRRSAKMIADFLVKYGINPDSLPKPVSEYKSFNEFFTRKQNCTIDETSDSLIAPADSRLSVYKIEEDSVISVKGCLYTTTELIQDAEESRKYKNGMCLVFRLCPTDYHRFCFPDNGRWQSSKKIKGFYETVNTFYTSGGVHATNYREANVLQTENFGRVAYIEVGAMLIGKIVNTKAFPGEFKKGEEKGYFEYGASTIVMLLQEGAAQIDPDILEQSALGRECLVSYGEKIGRRLGTSTVK